MEKLLEFTSQNMLLVLFLMISFFLLIFTELRRKASGLVSVDPNDAVALINNDAVVLDLRNAEAFGRGHIVNARNIPADELDVTSNKIASLKNRPIVTVCDAGITSTKAADSLRKSGFESVYGLKGGMSAWTQAGLPVVTGKKTKSKRRAKNK
ncbi:MAG: rhodanese-like domain-containing protein [Gammaproteobacteria bacterium]|nr:rhodanese-like domain-containing protein [Gammaproteobacteria bacterium]